MGIIDDLGTSTGARISRIRFRVATTSEKPYPVDESTDTYQSSA
jgi:hypothetical protein